MSRNRSDTHCSDDLLLAYLDGEIRGVAKLRVAAHLSRCWECRAQRSELERGAESLAKLLAKQARKQAAQTQEAHAAFLAWKDEFERNAARKVPTHAHIFRWSLGVAAACALVLMMLPWPAKRAEPIPTSAEVLRGVRNFEAGIVQEPGMLHQVFRVEVVENRPTSRRSAGRVEIWADRAGGRYVSRWLDEANSLKYAVWRQPGRVPLVYAALKHGRTSGSLSEPSSAVLTIEGLEGAFFDWLRSQDWRVTPDLSSLVAGDGTQMRVERLASGVLRLYASRGGNAIRAEFTMAVDAGSFRPRLLAMRLETADRTLELRVISDRLEVVPATRVDAAVFTPDVPRSRPTLMPEPAPMPEKQAAAARVEDPETDVLYAVHRVRACLAGNPEISTAPDGTVELRAIATNTECRAAFAEALRQVAGTHVRADIQIVAYARPGPERSHPLLSPEGLRVFDALYGEALALVRLAQRYAPERLVALPSRQQSLIESMVGDHMAALHSGTRAMRTEAEPALLSLAGATPQPADVDEPADWRAAAAGIFHVVDRIDNLIDTPQEDRREVSAHLLAAFAELERRTAQADGSAKAAER